MVSGAWHIPRIRYPGLRPVLTVGPATYGGTAPPALSSSDGAGLPVGGRCLRLREYVKIRAFERNEAPSPRAHGEVIWVLWGALDRGIDRAGGDRAAGPCPRWQASAASCYASAYGRTCAGFARDQVGRHQPLFPALCGSTSPEAAAKRTGGARRHSRLRLDRGWAGSAAGLFDRCVQPEHSVAGGGSDE
jgi:hypothetical protein